SRGLDAAAYRAMDQETIRRHLLDFHAGWHEPIPSILRAAENIVVTDTLDVATLPVWSRGRTLLIGDAAHATSPHAGQGASLALEDAMTLGRLMRQGQELGQTFQAFEQEPRARVERIGAIAPPHLKRQPGVTAQPLDELSLHGRAGRPDPSGNVGRITQETDRAFRDHLG